MCLQPWILFFKKRTKFNNGTIQPRLLSRGYTLCNGTLHQKANFKPTLQAKLINFLVWKFKSIILFFLRLFSGFFRPSGFYTLLLLPQRIELQFESKIAIQICQLFSVAATVCKKHRISQRKNEYNRFEFPDQKVVEFGL